MLSALPLREDPFPNFARAGSQEMTSSGEGSEGNAANAGRGRRRSPLQIWKKRGGARGAGPYVELEISHGIMRTLTDEGVEMEIRAMSETATAEDELGRTIIEGVKTPPTKSLDDEDGRGGRRPLSPTSPTQTINGMTFEKRPPTSPTSVSDLLAFGGPQSPETRRGSDVSSLLSSFSSTPFFRPSHTKEEPEEISRSDNNLGPSPLCLGEILATCRSPTMTGAEKEEDQEEDLDSLSYSTTGESCPPGQIEGDTTNKWEWDWDDNSRTEEDEDDDQDSLAYSTTSDAECLHEEFRLLF